MTKYICISSHASRGNFFQRKHTLTRLPDSTPFDYDAYDNIDGVHGKLVVEAESEFEAGIKFVKEALDFESIKELLELAHNYNPDSEKLERLTKVLEFFLDENHAD